MFIIPRGILDYYCSLFQSWDVYFRESPGFVSGGTFRASAGLAASVSSAGSADVAVLAPSDTMDAKDVIDDHLSVQTIIRSYQVRVMFPAGRLSNLFIMAGMYLVD